MYHSIGLHACPVLLEGKIEISTAKGNSKRLYLRLENFEFTCRRITGNRDSEQNRAKTAKLCLLPSYTSDESKKPGLNRELNPGPLTSSLLSRAGCYTRSEYHTTRPLSRCSYRDRGLDEIKALRPSRTGAYFIPGVSSHRMRGLP